MVPRCLSIVGWLVIAAIIFTLFFGFIQIRGVTRDRHVKGDYSDPNHKGEVSHFQALTTALSGTVGLGNIAGVAVAVSIGGPGSHILDDYGRPSGYGV